MPKSDWKKCKLGEVVNVKGGKRLPAGHVLVQKATNHPYLRVRDLTQRFPLKGNLEYITEDTFSHISRYIVKENDVVLSIVGSIGLVALINKNLNNISLTENAVRLFSTQVSPLFLYYYLLSPFGQAEIAKNTVGAVQAKLPIYGIQNIDIALPSLDEQKRIAGILGSLDDKIELLQKQNKTLEDMAKALFKSWFVDFDVVHAKANLAKRRRSPTETLGDDTLLTKADIMREYHLTDELYDLFPSDFENSSLGPIPLGWQVKTLGEFIRFVKGKKPKETLAFPKEGFLPQILIETLDTGKSLFANPEQCVLVAEEDLIMVMDGASSGRLGRGVSGVLGSTLSKIEVKSLPKTYIYYFLKRLEKDIKENTTGTSIPHTDKGRILNFNILLANKQLLNLFELLICDFFKKQGHNLKQIQTLTELRDTLLPPLISGKIRV